MGTNMNVRRRFSPLILFLLVVAASGCEVVDQARDRFATTDTISTTSGSGLALGLQAPASLSPGEEATLRLSLTNRSDTVISQVRLELIVPGWAEPVPPRVGDRPVTMAAMEDGSTLFSYRMDDIPLDPQQVETVEQRIRVPTLGGMSAYPTGTARTVRARLLDADGALLAEVESEIALDSVGMAGGQSPGANSVARRDRLGGVQLGMTVASVRQGAPMVRDTTWSQEGMQQRGLVVPMAGGTAVAVLGTDSTVQRIEVAAPSIRTGEGLGVGSTMADLRGTYGSPCAETAEGRVVAWFANAPGISFALDMAVPPNPSQLRENPDFIPATARVTRWWMFGGGVPCNR